MEDLYENVEDCRILINNSQLDEEVIKLCDKINTKIDEKYGSVARFSRTVNVPYSTLNCILKNGLSNSKFSMVLDICRRLRVDIFDIEKYGIIGVRYNTIVLYLTPIFMIQCRYN